MFFGGNSAATLQVTVLPTSVSEARMTVDGEAVAGLHVQVEPEVAHSVEISAPVVEPIVAPKPAPVVMVAEISKLS